MKRRVFIRNALVLLSSSLLSTGCTEPRPRSFEKDSKLHFLGRPQDLVFPAQMDTNEPILIIRDENGWAALEARCTYDGCDMSFNGVFLVCPCCRSYFDMRGEPVGGNASENLRWYEVGLLKQEYGGWKDEIKGELLGMEFVDREIKHHPLSSQEVEIEHKILYANSAKPVSKSFRFTTDALEKEVSKILRDLEAKGDVAVTGLPDAITLERVEGADPEPVSEMTQEELREYKDAFNQDKRRRRRRR